MILKVFDTILNAFLKIFVEFCTNRKEERRSVSKSQCNEWAILLLSGERIETEEQEKNEYENH